MYICKVKGKCVATVKNRELDGHGLVTVQPLNEKGKPCGSLMVAADMHGCSVGDTVLVTTGSGARLALKSPNSPVDLAIVGIVDSCDFE